MKCRDLLRMLNDYVDGDLDPGLCEEFEKHFAGCNPCKIVVDTVRRTIQVYRGARLCEMPLDFRERLRASLREKWKQLRSKKD
jgi:anti-sigma factor RsiW